MVNTDTFIIYQFRIRLLCISPVIWRRVQLRYDTSIRELHYILQSLMDWSDEHLNQFKIRGKDYGVYHIRGMSFSDNPDEVSLKDFNFRLNEKFIYEYNFTDSWAIEVRLEEVLKEEAEKKYPLCIKGSRIAPPEDCGGAWSFMELKDYYGPWRADDEFLQFLVKWKKGKITFKDVQNEADRLKYYVKQNLFKPSTATQKLQNYLLERRVEQ
jgi:hypothetical protein